MPRVSIIVPVYKVEAFLDQCIRTLLAQTYQDIEVLLVDDGSPDNCPAMIDKFAEAYPDKIRAFHKTNGGQGSARNFAIPHVTGEYLCFVDSDDTVSPDYVASLLEAALDTDADIVVCDIKRVNYLTGETRIQRGDVNGGQCSNLTVSPDWLFRVSPAAWDKLYRTEMFVECPDCRYPVGVVFEDLGLTPILLHRARRIKKIDKTLYNYLIHSSSTIRSNKRPGDIVKVLEIIRTYYVNAAPGLFNDELAMLFIKHGIIYRYFNEWPSRAYICNFMEVMQRWFPDWIDNPYLNELAIKDVKQLRHLHRYGATLHYTGKILAYKLQRLFKLVL